MGEDPNISWQSVGVIISAAGVVVAIVMAWGDIKATLAGVSTEIEVLRARDSIYDADHDKIIRLEQDWLSNYHFQSNKPVPDANTMQLEGPLEPSHHSGK